ncbi:MAG: galactokinase [Acidobacteriota bacterium]|nr:galactokinase [Acidobacteriota bacterium]
MIQEFQRRFGAKSSLPDKEIHVYRAPGRVNLIGEHTDYNQGLVLPIALDLATYAACGPSGDGRLRLISEHYRETLDIPVQDIPAAKRTKHWTDYVIGVAQQLLTAGFTIEPKNILIRSTVPDGSGLSSSAALEVSAALALLDGRAIEPLRLVQLCQKAENHFIGMPSGIMDQYISVFGQAHRAVELDCRGLTHELVELPSNVAILAVNSTVKHELAHSAYGERTEQCAMAVDALHRGYAEVGSLRDATLRQLEQTPLPAVIRRRARHVITEIARVGLFVNASRRGDLDRMGELFVESHLSLEHDYEVSCPELDFLVNAAIGIDGVYGARMTGGGFGGCTVNLVRPDAVEHVTKEIANSYRERFGINPPVFRCVPSQGAARIQDVSTIPA